MLSHEFIVERAKVCGMGCHMGASVPNLDHFRTILYTAKVDDWEALQGAWSLIQNYAHEQWAAVMAKRNQPKPAPGFEDLGGIVL